MKLARVLALVLLSLLALLVMTANARGEEPRAIAITAKRFEFVPSTITLKKGETVTLVVTSEDVTHGLFLRPLKIDADLTAGETMSAGSHRNTRRGWTRRVGSASWRAAVLTRSPKPIPRRRSAMRVV